jgi:hypothetical protein
MYMEEVTLPAPPEGYGYKLVPLKPRRTVMKDRDLSGLTSKQKSDLKYREKNREKILDHKRLEYQKEKESNLSKEEPQDFSKLKQ